jgi:hypothetical protein
MGPERLSWEKPPPLSAEERLVSGQGLTRQSLAPSWKPPSLLGGAGTSTGGSTGTSPCGQPESPRSRGAARLRGARVVPARGRGADGFRLLEGAAESLRGTGFTRTTGRTRGETRGGRCWPGATGRGRRAGRIPVNTSSRARPGTKTQPGKPSQRDRSPYSPLQSTFAASPDVRSIQPRTCIPDLPAAPGESGQDPFLPFPSRTLAA